MTTRVPDAHHDLGFSLVRGGLLYSLLLRARLQRPPVDWLRRRVLVLIAIAWLPLVVLTVLSGHFVGGVGVGFLFDVDAHIKTLIAFPLLVGAEVVVHRRIERVVQEFLDRGLVAPRDEARYEALVARATGLVTSSVAEVALLLMAFTGGYWLWRTRASLNVASWYATPREGGMEFTLAGYWYAFVSLPVGRFLIVRWFYRIAIWYVFLWKVARLRLTLNPLHPDRAGGLGFLQDSVTAFAIVPIAESTVLAGVVGSHILHARASLPDYKFEIAGFVVAMLLMLLIPPMFFMGQLIEAKWNMSHDFGYLAARYTREFREKWLVNPVPGEEGLLGTGDIQSLADLANSHEVLRTMRPVPFELRVVPWLALLIALPLLPLALTMIPFSELVEKLFKLLV